MGSTIAQRMFSRLTARPYDKSHQWLPTNLLCLSFPPSTVGHHHHILPKRQNLSRSNQKFGSYDSALLVFTNLTSFQVMSQASLRFSSTIRSGSSISRNKQGPVNRLHNIWLYVRQNANDNSTWTTALYAPPLQTTLDHRKAEVGLSGLTMVLLPTS